MKLVTKANWGARPPKRRYTASMRDESTGHWNGPTVTVHGKTTWDHSSCASLVRGIQNFHMDARGWNDIAYNFVVCPHGYVFEGRGLNTANGANGTDIGNKTSHAIMCIAGGGNPFSIEEKVGFRECVKYVSARTASPDRCKGHRDHKPTECPGEVRYAWVKQGMPLSGVVPQPPPPPAPPKPPPPPPTPPKPSSPPTLKEGMRGEEVRWAQAVIKLKAGGGIVVDGIFGPNTTSRVKDVQRYFNLTVDGVIGPKTWAILDFLSRLK